MRPVLARWRAVRTTCVCSTTGSASAPGSTSCAGRRPRTTGSPFIVLTGHSAFELDVEAMRAGAADYLLKDRIDAAALERAIRYTLERKRDREALANFNQLLEHRVQERTAELEQANAALRAAMDRSRQAEEGLKESQERLRLAMATAQMGYHYRDFETGMAIYSDQLGALCGLPSGSSFANYEQFLNAVHPDDRERVAEAVARATREDTDYVHEYRIIQPNGAVRWLADRGRVYRDEHGERLYALGLAWDVTARKEAEIEREALYAEERRLRERAEAADRAKDDFLALVSHELRTPLNAIVAWLHILETTPEPDAATLAKATAFLKRSVDQQRRLIGDLLDTARIASGKLQLEVRALDPAAVAEAALEVVRSAAEARGVEIYTLIDANAGPITGDAGRLQQVLWNLLSNAIKFTPRGGRVHLRIERVDPHVRIVVSDTGAGIDPELLPFVFDRFRQSDTSSKRRHGGLGLGLALVHYLVQLHGGSVRAESPGEDRGATFIVDLPVRAVRLPAPSVPPAAAGLGGPEVERGRARRRADTLSRRCAAAGGGRSGGRARGLGHAAGAPRGRGERRELGERGARIARPGPRKRAAPRARLRHRDARAGRLCGDRPTPGLGEGAPDTAVRADPGDCAHGLCAAQGPGTRATRGLPDAPREARRACGADTGHREPRERGREAAGSRRRHRAEDSLAIGMDRLQAMRVRTGTRRQDWSKVIKSFASQAVPSL